MAFSPIAQKRKRPGFRSGRFEGLWLCRLRIAYTRSNGPVLEQRQQRITASAVIRPETLRALPAPVK